MTLDILGIIASLALVLLAELTECAPWLAERLVRWAARRLNDPQDAARYEEEWLANLERVPGKLTPLICAVGIVFKAPCMRRALKPAKLVEAEKQGPRPPWGFGYEVGPRVPAEPSVALNHGLVNALGRGLVAGLVYGLIVGLIAGLGYGLIVGLVVGLGYALSHIVVYGLTHIVNRATSRR